MSKSCHLLNAQKSSNISNNLDNSDDSDKKNGIIIDYERERIDDLGIKGLKIIQNKDWFCFGIDSVILANFASNIKRDAYVLDLGTGTGVIPTLLCGKTHLKKVIGVEIQSCVCDMANHSIEYNKLNDRFEIICDSILNLNNYFEKQSFDVVVTNPPYKKKDTGIVNPDEPKMIARHEITASLEDFICVAKDMLKDKGEFYMVHRPERLVDVFCLMRKYNIEPKVVHLVCSKNGDMPKMVLIKGIKNAKPFVKIEQNLYIYNDNGDYTTEIKNMYENMC